MRICNVLALKTFNALTSNIQDFEDVFIQIKVKTAKERKRISDLVGEIFSQHLEKQKEG